MISQNAAPGTTLESTVGGDGNTVTTQKVVEASVITPPEWEGVAKARHWISDLIGKLEIAGGRTDGLERPWILECCVNISKKSVEDFSNVWPIKPTEHVTQEYIDKMHDQIPRLERMDRILGVSMGPMLKKYCPREFHQAQKHDLNVTFTGSGRKMGGRQKVFLFLTNFSTRGVLKEGARMEQIYTIRYPGDKLMGVSPGYRMV